MTNPLKYYDNNLNGTKVLLESMVAHDVKKSYSLPQQRLTENRRKYLS